ncbi:MAG: homoserine kinase [Leptospiraceae bacterium]|nr:homoserine kinase [Leptospiraceae bacterium]
MAKKISLKNPELYVKVPGTSANLGPGFDILGLSLEIYNEFYFSFGKDCNYNLKFLDGTPLPFPIEDNLIKVGYSKYFEKYLPEKEIIPFDTVMALSLPLKGGLGSSASALVTGFKAAEYAHKKYYKKEKFPPLDSILYELAMLEGHPDNTTPAYIGGFVFSFFSEDKLIYFQNKFPSSVKLFLFIPEIQIETNHSRKKLPPNYPVNDVVFNMARIGTWVYFLKSKKYKDLELAVEDRIHTPYRIKNEPALNSAIEIIKKLGACYSLSGSGPTLLIYCPKDKSKKFIEDFQKKVKNSSLKNTKYKILPIKTCNSGTRSKNLS